MQYDDLDMWWSEDDEKDSLSLGRTQDVDEGYAKYIFGLHTHMGDDLYFSDLDRR